MKHAITRAVGMLGLLTVVGATAATGVATAEQAPSSVARQPVSWQSCFDDLECGRVTVPADWRRPSGQKITVGLGKVPARDQSRKLGTLLVNTGGPNPAIFALPRLRDGYFAELTAWFDVVVFDPRGMGESSGVTCPTAAPQPEQWPPPDRATYNEYAETNRRFVLDCAQALGPLDGKLDSWQVAHDMEAIRVALGERKLNYFGNSYGTVFGQTYAGLFGRNVGRMYLDSTIDHTTGDPYDLMAPKAATLERNLSRFAQWCARDTACALNGRDALAAWDQVIETAARQPIPAPGAGPDVTVSVSSVVRVATRMLAREGQWADLATALAEARSGDATRFVPPPVPPNQDVPGAALMGTMTCADMPRTSGYPELKRVESELRGVAPRVGWSDVWNLLGKCAGLPRVGTFPPQPIKAVGLPPVLISNGSNDFATPPEYGLRVAAQLPGARYLPAEGGHALYFSGNSCVRENVHRYLTTGSLPPSGASCPAA